MSSRITRSQSRSAEEGSTPLPVSPPAPVAGNLKLRVSNHAREEILPRYMDLEREIQALPKRARDLLRLKHHRLRQENAQLWTFVQECRDSPSSTSETLAQAVMGTFVSAAEAAGTAICISPQGLLLTCAHCVAEAPNAPDTRTETWWLSASGAAVRARCVVWNHVLDLALLQVTAAPPAAQSGFAHAHIAASKPKPRAELICVGHPGSEDFEAAQPGQATGYDVLHVSRGKFRGYAPGQDALDNSDIGALQHDCWTYWGHSGALLLDAGTGELVGLHSSWDEETGMRRGVGIEAVRVFVEEWTESGA